MRIWDFDDTHGCHLTETDDLGECPLGGGLLPGWASITFYVDLPGDTLDHQGPRQHIESIGRGYGFGRAPGSGFHGGGGDTIRDQLPEDDGRPWAVPFPEIEIPS